MKKLSKISLHTLSQAELAKREQNVLRGGDWACCTNCSCRYEGSQEGPDDSFYGGSSTEDNRVANNLKLLSAT